MAARCGRGKLYELFTFGEHLQTAGKCVRHNVEGRMIGLALAMFVALFGWGERYFGWEDAVGKVQLALFTSFILGAVCGYKSKA